MNTKSARPWLMIGTAGFIIFVIIAIYAISSWRTLRTTLSEDTFLLSDQFRRFNALHTARRLVDSLRQETRTASPPQASPEGNGLFAAYVYVNQPPGASMQGVDVPGFDVRIVSFSWLPIIHPDVPDSAHRYYLQIRRESRSQVWPDRLDINLHGPPGQTTITALRDPYDTGNPDDKLPIYSNYWSRHLRQFAPKGNRVGSLPSPAVWQWLGMIEKPDPGAAKVKGSAFSPSPIFYYCDRGISDSKPTTIVAAWLPKHLIGTIRCFVHYEDGTQKIVNLKMGSLVAGFTVVWQLPEEIQKQLPTGF